MAITVYRYGCPSKADLPEEGIQQLRLAHELRNNLVEIERAHEEAIANVWGSHPAVADTKATLDEATAALLVVTEKAKAERKTDRTTAARPETATELKDAKRVLKEARAAHRESRDTYYATVKPAMVEARKYRGSEIKALYAVYVQTRGLYWATWNDVVDHHKTAVKRIGQIRKEGRPAELRFHRWDGSGSLTVQLQRGKDAPARTPELLASGEGPWKQVCQVAPWISPEEFTKMTRGDQRRAGRGHVRMRIGKTAMTLPVQVHRMMPAEADVALMRVTRRRIAGGHRVHVTVTAKVPDPPAKTEGPIVALHLGWRVRPNRDIRVGVWASATPLTPPPSLQDIVTVRGDGTWGEILAPAKWRDGAKHIEGLRGQRDLSLERIKGRLATWLDEYGAKEIPGRDGEMTELTGTLVRQWRSPARLVWLTKHWRTEPPVGAEEIAEELEAWRKQDRHLWEWEAHGRDNKTAARKDAWRRVAAWLGTVASTVAVDDTDISRLTRVPEVGTEDSPQAQAARSNRVVAAPGELRAAVKQAATSRGALIAEQKSAGETTIHFACGTENPRDERYAEEVTVWCDGCPGGYDQDHNATLHLLAASGGIKRPAVIG